MVVKPIQGQFCDKGKSYRSVIFFQDKKQKDLINDSLKKHDHLVIKFNNIKLIYNDPRRFGFVDLVESKKYQILHI